MIQKNEYLNLIKKYPTAWIGHADFAIELVQTFKPNVIVDLGVDYGFSTFCLAYPNIGNVYGIDWFQGDEMTGFRNTESLVAELYSEVKDKFGISNIEFIKSDFAEAAKTWNKKIDLLHIDGFHSYDAVKNDFENWIGFCNDDAIVIFHDVELFIDTVGKFFAECDGYKLINTGSCGLGILTKSEEKYNIIKNILGN